MQLLKFLTVTNTQFSIKIMKTSCQPVWLNLYDYYKYDNVILLDN